MENTSEFDSDAELITNEVRPERMSRSEDYSSLDAEKVLEGFGTFGAYQMLVYGIVNTGYFLCGCESRVFSLILDKPEFMCNRPEEFNGTLDQCEYLDYEANSTIKCSNFSYKEGKYAYVTSEFDLVCDNAYYMEYSMFLYMLGGMLFAPIFTQLGDLHGRRITYLVLLWLTVLSNIGCALASNRTLFMGLIFVAGIGATGVEVVGYILMLETVAPSFRSYTPLISTISWVAGYTTVGIVHMLVGVWRWELLILISPFILTISYYFFLPESIHWLITHNKTAEVEKWIKTAEKFSNKTINLEECRNQILLIPSEDSKQDIHEKTFMDIFSNGPMVFQLVCHCYIMVVLNFTYWALSIFSTELHENKMMGYFLSNFAELPAAGTAFLLIYFGRRSVTSFSLFSQAAAMSIAIFYPGKNLISMTLFLLVKGFNGFAWVTEPLLIGEMAPTSTRNIFYGLATFVGKIGSVCAPYFNKLKKIHEVAPAISMGLLSLIAGFLVLCSPETANVPMPEDINDFDPGPVYPWIFERRRNNRTENTDDDSSTPLLRDL